MSFEYAKLTEIQFIPATAADVFTSATGVVSYVRSIILHNGHNAAEVITLYTIPASQNDTFGLLQQWFKRSLAADETIFIDIPIPGIILAAGDAIGADTETASKVTIQIYGGAE